MDSRLRGNDVSICWVLTVIPAKAGMTNSGPLVIEFPNAQPMLALPLFENLFWIRMIRIVYHNSLIPGGSIGNLWLCVNYIEIYNIGCIRSF